MSLSAIRLKAVLPNLLFNLGCLADPAAKEVQFRSADITAADNLYVFNVRRMNRENPFHADAVRNAPDCERLGNAASLAGHNGSFKGLNSLVIAFADINAHANRVAD